MNKRRTSWLFTQLSNPECCRPEWSDYTFYLIIKDDEHQKYDEMKRNKVIKEGIKGDLIPFNLIQFYANPIFHCRN